MDISDHPAWSELLNPGGDLAMFPALWIGVLDLRGLLVFSATRDEGCIHLGCDLNGNTLRRRMKVFKGCGSLG